MKNQRGQDLVEFALLIPLFFIFIFGIMYCGFLFGDYVTLNNEARSAAREAVIGVGSLSNSDDNTIKDYYETIVKKYSKEIDGKGMITRLYKYDGMLISEGKKEKRTYSNIKGLSQVPGEIEVADDSVIVIIKTELNSDFLFPLKLKQYGVPLLDGYQIRYVMFNENYK